MAYIDVQKIGKLLDRENNKRLRQIVTELKIQDLAAILDELPKRHKLKFYLLTPTKNSSDLLLELSPYSRKFILKSLKNKYIASMLESTESDDSADILGEVPQETQRKIFSFLTKSKKEAIAPLIKYEDGTAGAIMQSEIITLPQSLTVKEAIPKMKKALQTVEGANNAYIVDSNGRLKGIVTLRNLFFAKQSERLSRIMKKDIITLNPNQTQQEVAQIFKDEDYVSLAVVDRNKKLLGRITVDDVVDLIEEEVSEDMLKIAGVNPDEGIFDPVFSSIKRRLPWLTINLGTAIIAAITIALFSKTIEAIVILAALMPIIAGMGGNSGTQTLTLIVRGLALDQINVTNYMKIVRKEVILGTINGAVIGLVMGFIAYLWTSNIVIGIIIVISMIITLMVAGLTGTLTPLFLKRMNIDPAVASSVIVTTFTDVVGFFVFLGVATSLIQFLI